MKHAYLLIYSDGTGARQKIREWANAERRVVHWRFDMPYSFYLISEAPAKELAESLRTFTNNKGRFLITEVSDNRWGWLPNETWYLLKNKAQKPKDP